MRQRHKTLLLVAWLAALPAYGQLPPVPVPVENPISESKRVLGKILFWDEQLSSDDTVACGTCHRPTAGGGDPRSGTHPGSLPGSVDDVRGSPGIRRLDIDGRPVADPVFGDGPQVTSRLSPSIYGALWAAEIFWDGRAGQRLIDPVTGSIVIESGAALENQILETLMSPAEMAKAGRRWNDLTDKLADVEPLGLADRWPEDVVAAIEEYPGYPELFRSAFGDQTITPTRIAMAIASYERTLIADQTPWDQARAGDTSALDAIEQLGWQTFQTLRCTSCHEPPLFTTNQFANIGLRRSEHDRGRSEVTGERQDDGDMKIPSLRNVGLRPRLMHTGEFTGLFETIDFYRMPAGLPDTDELPDGGAYNFNLSQQNTGYLFAFLSRALTDARLAAESFPFDRPRLRSERQPP